MVGQIELVLLGRGPQVARDVEPVSRGAYRDSPLGRRFEVVRDPVAIRIGGAVGDGQGGSEDHGRAADEANAIAAARVKTMGRRPRTRCGPAGIRKLFYSFRSLRHVSIEKTRQAAIARPIPAFLPPGRIIP